MLDYKAPTKDIRFALSHFYNAEKMAKIDAYAEYDPDFAEAIIEEAAKFAQGVLAPLNQSGDREGCRIENGQVYTPSGWKDAYDQFCEMGWMGLSMSDHYGGQDLPDYIASAVAEMWSSANMSFVMLQILASGSCEIIEKIGSDEIKDRYLEKMISGQWSACMSMSEPAAGSDLSTIRTKAERLDDGRYRITGQKIFISYGDHDVTENIVHLVLARTPDAPAGTRGISLFVVPKFLVNEDGSLGEFNDIRCTSIEHKLGLHGSPTCSLSYGDDGGAIGELIGEENKGLSYMFILMNHARLSIGLQGVATGQLAYQSAHEHARERLQGRNLITGESPVALDQHPDVQRMLLTIRAQTFAFRMIAMQIATRLDKVKQAKSPEEKQALDGFIGLMTPVFKGYATEVANAMAGTGIQVFGGMGFVEETGVAQLARDVRIATIYEGTTGVHANDLMFRKILLDEGKALNAVLEEMQTDQNALSALSDYADEAAAFSRAMDVMRAAETSLLGTRKDDKHWHLSGAFYFLEMMGILSASWQMVKTILQAQDNLNVDQDPAYHNNLIALARFYLGHFTPRIGDLSAVWNKADQGITDYDFTED